MNPFAPLFALAAALPFLTVASASCVVCQAGNENLNVNITTSCQVNQSVIANGTVVTGTCAGHSWTSTCTANGMTDPDGYPEGIYVVHIATPFHDILVCIAQLSAKNGGLGQGNPADCSVSCESKAAGINKELGLTPGIKQTSQSLFFVPPGAYCSNCTNLSSPPPAVIPQYLVLLCNCVGPSFGGFDTQGKCCVNCLSAGACADVSFSFCMCDTEFIPCPTCSNSKDSNKLLLLLLLLLLLIPLCLCCLLLLGCLIKRKKTAAPAHITTFPQGGVVTAFASIHAAPCGGGASMPYGLPTTAIQGQLPATACL